MRSEKRKNGGGADKVFPDNTELSPLLHYSTYSRRIECRRPVLFKRTRLCYGVSLSPEISFERERDIASILSTIYIKYIYIYRRLSTEKGARISHSLFHRNRIYEISKEKPNKETFREARLLYSALLPKQTKKREQN